MSDAIALAPPDPAWPARFAAEAARLRTALPAELACTIEHFGSTAVPDMPAKPIVDVMMIVPERARWGELVAPLERLGYSFWRDNPAPDRMLFVKGLPPAATGRTHHVHVRLPDDARAELRFRDALRADRDLARRYLALKVSLAARHREDREAYTEGKTEFVAEALAALDRG